MNENRCSYCIMLLNIQVLSFNSYYFPGTSPFESGGAGTVFVESISSTGEILKQKLTIDNNGHDHPRAAVVSEGQLRHVLNGVYDDIRYAGGITWLSQESLTYDIEELDIRGNAHMAILSDSWSEVIEANVLWLWGDKTGVLHVGMNQTVKITDVDVYMPVNLAAYRSV